jgi:hypothetical protein
MAFNLEDYEDVATLNKWFIANYPMGRSDISVISHDAEKGYILVQATYGVMLPIQHQLLATLLLDQEKLTFPT